MFEQDRLLVRLQQRVQQMSDVLVCYLTGSFGRGSQDSYSDLDITLVFEDDEHRESAFAERREFVQSVLPYVPARSFDASHVRPYFHVALYSNGAKADYLYETVASSRPSQYEKDIRLLKDTGDIGRQFQMAASKLKQTIPQPTIGVEELAELDDRFWVMFMDIYRQLRRGDYDKPYAVYLELLYFTIPQILRLLPPEEAARQSLIQARYEHDTRATTDHMIDLMDAYLDARAAIVRRHNLIFEPNQSFETALLSIIRK